MSDSRDYKVKIPLTRDVAVNLPSLPNFLIHEDGDHKESVPVHMFSDFELKKVAKAWSEALLKHAHRKRTEEWAKKA